VTGAGVRVRDVQARDATNFPLGVRAYLGDRLGFDLAYDPRLFDRDTARQVAARLRLLLTGIATELDLRGDPSGLSAAACDLLQKTLQEALVNIAKHACARRATVCIEVGGDQASIRVADDGVGLPAGVAEAARARHGHLGLRQMRERIEAAGGRLEIVGRPGAGFSIRGEFPLPLDGK